MIELSPLSGAEYLLIVIWFIVSYVSMAIGPPGGIKSAAVASILPPSVAIPIQATVETISGIHRLWLLRFFVDWRFLLSFAISGVAGFGIGLGARFIVQPPDDILRIVMGLSILLTAWLPLTKMLVRYKAFPWLVGALTCFISLFTGGIAPFINAAIDNKYEDHKQTVATLTGSLLYQHGVKLVLFGLFGFSFGAYALLMAGLLLAGLAGTWLGRKLLFSVPKAVIKPASKTLVTLAALYLLVQGIAPFYRELGWSAPTFGTIASAEAKPMPLVLTRPERRLAQLALAGLGYDPGSTIGEFTETTELALAEWQLRQGRTGSGLFSSRKELIELLDQADEQTLRPLVPETHQLSEAPVIAIEPTIDVAAEGYQPFESFRDCPGCPEMVMLPAGSFLMGSPAGEQGRSDREGPQHKVAIDQPFAMGKLEVTFDEYDQFAERTARAFPSDSGWGRERFPVIFVSFEDARDYCAWIGEKTGKDYQLPSEALWEYAARAGTTTPFAFGAELLPEQANFRSSVGRTTKVGSYPANGWGIYDMHGNVREWVQDGWNPSYHGAPNDGSAWAETHDNDRVLRGGSWASLAREVRAAYRNTNSSGQGNVGIGFRCARV